MRTTLREGEVEPSEWSEAAGVQDPRRGPPNSLKNVPASDLIAV